MYFSEILLGYLEHFSTILDLLNGQTLRLIGDLLLGLGSQKFTFCWVHKHSTHIDLANKQIELLTIFISKISIRCSLLYASARGFCKYNVNI